MPMATSIGQVRGSLTIPAAATSQPGTYCFPGQSGVRNWSPGLASRPTRPGATTSRPALAPPSYAFANGAAASAGTELLRQPTSRVAVQAPAPNGCVTRRGREPAIEAISVSSGRIRSPVTSPSPPAGSPPVGSPAWVPPQLAEPLVGGHGVTTGTLRPVIPARAALQVEGSRSDHSPPLPRHTHTAKSPAVVVVEQQEASGSGARLTATAASLGSSASVPTLISERVPSWMQHTPQVAAAPRAASPATPEAQMADLKRQLVQAQEALTSTQKLAEERGQEVGTLLARTDTLLARISERDAEVLRLRAQTVKHRDEAQGASQEARRPTAEELNDPQQVAARRLQRAIRPWLAGLRKNRDEASTLARDRWKQMLQEVEAAVSRALEHAVGTYDVGRVPRQTRLQLLGNTLKHGVLRVNQVMMQQTLQELRRTAVT